MASRMSGRHRSPYNCIQGRMAQLIKTPCECVPLASVDSPWHLPSGARAVRSQSVVAHNFSAIPASSGCTAPLPTRRASVSLPGHLHISITG